MTAIDVADAPQLVGTQPPPAKQRMILRRTGRDNPFETIPLGAYEQLVWRQPSMFVRAFLVSDPAGLRQVLVEKVANYPKTPLENRFFRALLGDGLLSAEGDTWKRHRRIMAPSFDPRSVMSYANGMAERSAVFADGWSNRAGEELDVSAEMTALTLDIICRAMFSADGAEMTGL